LKLDLQKLVVLDIETLCNCFICNALDYKTGAKKSFVFFDDPEYANQPLEFYKFLRTCVKKGYTTITFNGLAFDCQIIHWYFEFCNQKVDPLYELEISEIIRLLYDEAQRIIALQDDEREKLMNLVAEHSLFLPTIDLFKQKHYDRKAKVGLKWIEFTMNYWNIEEMPIPHDAPVTKDQVAQVVEYCWNDVDATHQFFKLNLFETELRMAIGEEYGKNLINASEPKMAREIFGKLLSEAMGIPYGELKKKQTVRKTVAFDDIIFPYIKFLTPELQKVLEYFRGVVINTLPNTEVDVPGTTRDFSYSFNYNGLSIDLGLGGIHSCAPAGIYMPTDDEVIEDADVTSFYPKLGIENGLKPAHLGTAFSKIYNDLFEQRQLIPKKDPKNYVYKILLNSTYGLSGEVNSYFYDKRFMYSITVNGQLSLLMLVEALYKGIPGVRIIQKNTDGITFIYKKAQTETVRKICAWWEKITKMKLEYAYYKKMVVMDVNNYIGIYTDAAKEPKRKGMFDTTVEYHKNPSFQVVPKALSQYYVNDVPVRDSVMNHENIYDFCAGVKRTRKFKLNLYRDFGDAKLCTEQQKVTRYFVSTPNDDSGLLVKDFTDGRKVSVIANTLVQPLNTIKPGLEHANRYDINYSWYIKQCDVILEKIEPKVIQSTLF
jgi:hypothetical protein